MTTPTTATGTITTGFEAVGAAFDALLVADPTYSAQLCVYVAGQPVVDLTIGAGLSEDSLLPIFSSGKGTIGVTVTMLVQRGLLDLDAPVASYWPEFAANGKAAVTVRQLLSHQAGLVAVDGGYTGDELLAHNGLAERLAAQRPFWQPGRAFGYHSITIGVLADELIRRITGRSLSDVFRDVIAVPRSIDVHVGTPAELDHRVAAVDLPTPEEMQEWAGRIPLSGPDALGTLGVPRVSIPVYLWVNEPELRRVGPPAAGVLASARGLARMYAALHHDLGGGRIAEDDAIAQTSQLQAVGLDVTNDLPMRFGIVFQRPLAPRLEFGSALAFGHDGLGGSMAFSDPFYDVAFGYLTKRIPLPGGVDQRAIHLAAVVRKCVLAAR